MLNYLHCFFCLVLSGLGPFTEHSAVDVYCSLYEVLYFAVLLDRCLVDINSTSQYFPFRGKKGALDSKPQVIKFTSCLPMVGGSLRVLRLPPPLKTGRHDIAEILLKVALKHQKINKSINQSIHSEVKTTCLCN